MDNDRHVGERLRRLVHDRARRIDDAPAFENIEQRVSRLRAVRRLRMTSLSLVVVLAFGSVFVWLGQTFQFDERPQGVPRTEVARIETRSVIAVITAEPATGGAASVAVSVYRPGRANAIVAATLPARVTPSWDQLRGGSNVCEFSITSGPRPRVRVSLATNAEGCFTVRSFPIRTS
jgi:hypothetical protein